MSFLWQIADTWQALIDLIIRPPRHEYNVNRDLGPRRLVVKGGLVIREDIEVHRPCDTPTSAHPQTC